MARASRRSCQRASAASAAACVTPPSAAATCAPRWPKIGRRNASAPENTGSARPMLAVSVGFGSMRAMRTSSPAISLARAKEIALARVHGAIVSSELEREKGRLIYSFDIRTTPKRVVEVNVDARSGAIVEVAEETPADEAKERAADRAKERA